MKEGLIILREYCAITWVNLRKGLSIIRNFCRFVKLLVIPMERLWLITALGLIINY